MKLKKYLYCLFLLLSINSLSSQNWPYISQDAKPAARWWWLGSAVDSVNLTYNLEEYAKAGLGGLEITPIYGVQNNDKNNITFLSSKWLDMLKFTEAEGKRLGITIDMNGGTGWPFGGPWVSLDEAATKAIFQKYTIKGNKKINLDVSVKDQRQRNAVLIKVMAYSEGQIFNLTSKVNSGILEWYAPQGDWNLVVLYLGKTFQKVKRAAPGGIGWVMDHLNKNAVDNYLTNISKAFKKNNQQLPHSIFNDSYEVYGADWTPDLLNQFFKRRGYKLENHFLEFLDENRNEVTSRIITDYRETISDMLLDNFTRRWTDWAHRNGSITRNQAHGSPANLIDNYAVVDIPECEGFGLSQFNIKGLRTDSLTRKNDSDLSMLKYASSAAHITNKPLVSSETFTWLTEHFRTSLSQCKPDMDLMFVSGVNHMFFHGITYSPKEAKWPGWKFYASIDMSPTNNIWRDAPEFFTYISRCQSFLQMGNPDNDFLVYLPVYDIWQSQPGRFLTFSIHEMSKRAPDFIESIKAIINCGFDVDYISDRLILNTETLKGKLKTQGGNLYKALILPSVKFIPHDILGHLLKLAKEGATLVFMDQYPEDVPGYGKLTERRLKLKKIKTELPIVSSFEKTFVKSIGKGSIIIGSNYESVLKATKTEEEKLKTQYGLQYIRRRNDTGHHYFISSLQEKNVEGWVTLAVKEEDAMFFQPMNGEKGKAKTRKLGDNLQVYLQLNSGESIILQTFNDKIRGISDWNYIKKQPLSLNIDKGWNFRFIESTPTISESFNIDTLCSWTTLDHPNVKINMGVGLYSTEIDLPNISCKDWILDLGDVRESARVRINGNYAGTVWAVPFQLKIGKWLKKGKNTIEIEVTNLPANRITQMDKMGITWRIFNEINVVDLKYKTNPYIWKPMPSGLNSSVKLFPIN